MNTLPYDVLGIIVSLLPTPKDFSSFSLVNKKTRIATQTPYVLLEAKNRFAKRVYGECEKNSKQYCQMEQSTVKIINIMSVVNSRVSVFGRMEKRKGMRRGGTKMVN
jgi:hypothetical protein